MIVINEFNSASIIQEKFRPVNNRGNEIKNSLSEKIWEILACPHCGHSMSKIENGAKCFECYEEYTYSNGQLDLRLHRKKSYELQFELGNNLLPEKGFDFQTLQKNTSSQLDFTDIKVPWHLNKELMSYFPKAKGNDSIMLDLGCGSTVHREVCEYAGFEYVGLDYNSPDALILGDAHALPFKDNSFEFILSIAVLEHIRYPFIMMREAYRVLKSGGRFIGTVAFLEPFHDNSFYHHTHLGTYNSLKFSGLDIKYISPSVNWHVLTAQAGMLFPRLPMSKSLVLPLHLLHRIWWKLNDLFSHSDNRSEKYRILYTTGAFSFIADKREYD